MKHYLILAIALLICSPLPVSADFFSAIQSIVKPDSKEGKILAGATQMFASSRDIDYKTEKTIGEGLALDGLTRFGNPVNNEQLQQYVNLVGTALAANCKRSTITYSFAVLDSPVQNAFAVPGGVIFISRALFGILDNEAELAGVLAHELGHVAAKHALKSTQRAQLLQGAGTITAASVGGGQGKKLADTIGSMQTVLFDKGLDKDMEYEADLAAMETAYRTGYDPAAFIRVLEKLQKLENTSKEKNGSWFSTHPPLAERIARLKAQLATYPDYAKQAHVDSRFQRYLKMK